MAKPTHTIYVRRKNRKDSYSREVGVAWENEKGWISVRLHPGTCLTDRDDLWINLYPNPTFPEPEVVDNLPSDVGDPPDYMDEIPPPTEESTA